MSQPELCIFGYTVQVRQRNFKRRSTMLKHGRFMANLQVCPIYPKPIEPVEEIPDNESGAGSQE